MPFVLFLFVQLYVDKELTKDRHARGRKSAVRDKTANYVKQSRPNHHAGVCALCTEKIKNDSDANMLLMNQKPLIRVLSGNCQTERAVESLTLSHSIEGQVS